MRSTPGEQIELNAKINAWDNSMSWIMTLQLMSQMQDTELQSNTYHHRVGTTVSGKASQATECDEHASNVTMYNVTMNACEKEDQWSIELKMLVEHGRENIYFNSVTSACVVEKQLAQELAVFRSMGATCVEKTHRSNSVLMNTLRVAASALHQPVTSAQMRKSDQMKST